MAVFEATLKAKLNGQDNVNVIHFERPDAVQSDMGVLAARLDEFFLGHVVFVQSSRVGWYQIQIRHIAEDPWVTVVMGVARGGQFFSSPSFGPLTLVLQKRTAFSGVRNRGRIHISGIYDDGLTNGGAFSPDSLVVFQGLADSLNSLWVTDGGTQGFRMILHPRDVVGPVGTDVTELVVRSYPGTQVRRNLFRGV